MDQLVYVIYTLYALLAAASVGFILWILPFAVVSAIDVIRSFFSSVYAVEDVLPPTSTGRHCREDDYDQAMYELVQRYRDERGGVIHHRKALQNVG